MKLSRIAVLAYLPDQIASGARAGLLRFTKLHLLTPAKNMDISMPNAAYICRVIEMGGYCRGERNFTKTIIPTNLLIFRVVLN